MNLDLYCVAPIVKGNAQLTSYDFWAVGVNCCSGAQSDFRCGEYTNPHSKSGLRLMKDDQRPFYRLAVQQSTSTEMMVSSITSLGSSHTWLSPSLLWFVLRLHFQSSRVACESGICEQLYLAGAIVE